MVGADFHAPPAREKTNACELIRNLFCTLFQIYVNHAPVREKQRVYSVREKPMQTERWMKVAELGNWESSFRLDLLLHCRKSSPQRRSGLPH